MKQMPWVCPGGGDARGWNWLAHYLWLERSFPNIEVQIKFNFIFEALNLYYNTYGATWTSYSRACGFDVTEHWFLFERTLILLKFYRETNQLF